MTAEIHDGARPDLLSGVPMNWMTRWPGRFPIFVAEARGAEVVDVDGKAYVRPGTEARPRR